MSITRKNLREKLGAEVSDETISELLNLFHTEVDGIRDERDEIQKKYDAATAELETSKTAKEKAEKDLVDFKTEQTKRETRSAKEAAYKELLKEAGIGEKRFNSILKVTDFDSLELDKDGKISGSAKVVEAIKSDYSDFVEKVSIKKNDVDNPPHNDANKPTKEQFAKMGYSARVELLKNDPETYNELTKEN